MSKKKWYKILSIIVMLTILLSSSNGINMVSVSAGSLPADVQAKKDNFDSLKEVVKKYPTTYVTQVNNNEKRIQSITVTSTPTTVNGTKEIALPTDIVRVMNFFDHCYIYCTDGRIQDLQFSWTGPTIGGGVTGQLHNLYIGNYGFDIKMNTIVVKHPNYSGYKIIAKGKGKISKIVLETNGGLPTQFDTNAYGELGSDKPILDVSVSLDATKKLNIEGIDKFETEKYKRLYATTDGPREETQAAEYFLKKGFLPGRGMFKFSSALSYLKQDPNRPGYADYKPLRDNYTKNSYLIEQYDRMYGKDIEYAMCLDNYPLWMLVDPNRDLNRGTPARDKFDAAADLAAQYVKAYATRMDGRGPKYYEVKNESTIPSEWAYHSSNPNESWKYLAEFHNKVANRIKSVNPQIKVGGPTSAWMQLDAGAFSLAQKQLKFMDDTKGSLDFYSHHFYEGSDLMVNQTDKNYGGYLGGRLEADLDLLRNHMILTNNVKPILISETGTLHSGKEDTDYWLSLKNFNSYMVRYMNRPNEFIEVVPFLLPIKWWDKTSPDMLFTYNSAYNGISALTPLHYFLDMWEDYKGDLIPIESNNDKVYVHAAQDKNVIYAAVNNLNPQRVNVDLKINTGDRSIKKIERKNLYLSHGKLVYNNKEESSLNDIRMAVEETSIFKITLDNESTKDNTVYRNTYYGDKTLISTGTTPAEFKVNCPVKNLKSSVLRVGFGKTNGFQNADMTVMVNGKEYTKDLAYTSKQGNFFSYVDFKVPVSVLKDRNTITVKIPQSGGKISTVALINESYEKKVETPDKEEQEEQGNQDQTNQGQTGQGPTVVGNKMEAENYSAASGIKVMKSNDFAKVGFINNNDYICYNNIDLSYIDSITFRASSANNGGTLEIRQDSKTGTLLGSCKITSTQDWNTFSEFTAAIKPVSKKINMYLVFKGEDGYLYDLDYLVLNEKEVEFVNGNFEAGNLNTWVRAFGTGKLELSTKQGCYAGWYGLKYTNYGSVKTTITGLKPSTRYEISFYAKEYNTTKGTIGVKNCGTKEVYSVIAGNTYKKYTLRFETSANSTKADVYVYNAQDSGIVFADNFAITKCK